MPNLNYASQYAQALSQQYANVLHFGAIFARNQEGDYRWTSAKTVEVPSLSTTGRTDVNRDEISSAGRNFDNSWTPLTLRNFRKWKTLIHPRDIDETNQAASIANITKTFNETQKFPEMDKYLISTAYSDWRGKGRVPFSGTLTVNNILEVFDAMMEAMTENNVPAFGRHLYIPPYINTILMNAKDIAKNRDILTRTTAVTRAITELDNVEIEVVPSDHMLTAYDFTVGAVRGASAKQIEMWLVHPSCIITPINYEFAKLDPPAAGSDGKYIYYEESEEDCFLLPNKEAGCEFFVAGEALGTATFSTAAYTGTGAVIGDCTITVSAPSGTNLLAGSRYFYKEQASTAPDAPGAGECLLHTEWIEWDGTSVVNAANGHKMTFVVTDTEGRAYAAGNGTVTSKAS